MKKQFRFNGLLSLVMALALVLNTAFIGFSETNAPTTPASSSKSPLIGKYVDFGKYQGETINWQITAVDAQQNVTLWSTKALCLKMLSYHDCRYPTLVDDPEWEAEYWKGSTLRAWLNSADQNVKWMFQPAKHNTDYYGSSDYDYDQEPGFLSGFTDWERQALIMNTRNNISRFNDPLPTEDLVYILSVNEVMDLKSKGFSIIKEGTDYVWKQMPDQIGIFGKTIPYWTDTTDFLGGMLIDNAGKEDNTGAFLQPFHVNGICPALTVKADQFKVSKGNGSKNSPYVLDLNGLQTVGTLSAALESGSGSAGADIGLWAVETGLITQSETKLLTKTINNEQLAVLAYRLYVEMGGTKLKSANGGLAKDTKNPEALKAVALNLVSTQGVGKIGIKSNASKLALARVIFEIYQLVEDDAADTRMLHSYKDLAIAGDDYDISICDFLVTHGIMAQKDTKNFGMSDQVTLEQTLGIMKKFADHAQDLPKNSLFPNLTIGKGWAGDHVYRANQLLQLWKTNNSILNSIEIFSVQMAADLQGFQKENGLPVSGQLDCATWERLNNPMIWGAKNLEITFADAEVERYVRELLKQPEGPLMDTQIYTISELNLLEEYKVNSLEDLPKFKNIKKIYLKKQPLKNLGNLADMKNLTEFYAIDMPDLDFSPIGSKVDLTTVVIQGCQLKDIEFLSKLTKLEEVALDHNAISDLEPLTGKPIYDLSVEDNQVSDIMVVSSLKNLLIANMRKNHIEDLKSFESLKHIDRLDVSENPLANLTPLKGVSTLTQFECDGSGTVDLSPLAGNKSLEMLIAKDNLIKRLDVVKNFKNLKSLELANNQVTSLEPIRGLKRLYNLDVHENPIKDISVLGTNTGLVYLGIDSLDLDYSVLKPLPEFIRMTLKIDIEKVDLAINSLALLSNKKGLEISANFDFNGGSDYYFGITSDYSLSSENLRNPETAARIKGIYERAKFAKNQILAEITKPGMTELEKVTYVNQWLISHVAYDDDFYYRQISNAFNDNPIGVLAGNDSGSRLAICAGYASTADYLLKLAGVTSYVVVGHIGSPTGTGHAWNLVRIDGSYYHMDSTWNDSDYRPNEYFLVSDTEIQQAGDRYWNMADYPAAPSKYFR